MRALLLVLAVAAAVIGATSWLGFGPVVINQEGQQRIALLLGTPTVITEPGVRFAVSTTPMQPIERRWLLLASQPRDVQTRDGETLKVDNYVIWRIVDPLAFREAYPSTTSGDLAEAERQIDRATNASIADVIGKLNVHDVVDAKRLEAMTEISNLARKEFLPRGIEIRDVRLNRTELPPGNEENVYARMRSERERLARKFRAEGEEEARRIRAEADREARVLIAEATRDAEILRGQGDAESARIYADSFGADPEFFDFVRSLDAYRKTIGEGTTMVLPPDHQFFRAMQQGGETP